MLASTRPAAFAAFVWLLAAAASTGAAQEIHMRPVVRPPPVTLEELKQLQGSPPTGPCSLPNPEPALVPARYFELPDTSRLELAAGWESRPLYDSDAGYIDLRLATPDSTRLALSRQRNGAHGRTYLRYRNRELAKGETCTVAADSVGAIWDLYEPDPGIPNNPRPYQALGAVVTSAGHWYNVTVWSSSVPARARAVSTITALLLRQRE
jgi:hypothetical protein